MRKALALLLSFSILTFSLSPAFATGRSIQPNSAGQALQPLNAGQLGSLGSPDVSDAPALSSPLEANAVAPISLAGETPRASAPALPVAEALSGPSSARAETAPQERLEAALPPTVPGSSPEETKTSGPNLDPNIRAALRSIDGLVHPAAPMADAQASADGEIAFDGARPAAASANHGAPARLAAAARFTGRLAGKVPLLGRLVPARFSGRNPRVKTALDRDDYGGPPHKALSVSGRLFYGVKWSVHLLGIYSLLELINPIIAAIPWPLYLSSEALTATGRVELLTQLGQTGIANIILQYPIQFLFSVLPTMVLSEEISFRLMSFSVPFFALATLRPLTEKLRNALDSVEDLFHIRSFAQGALRLAGKLSRGAYAIAALWSAYVFTTAHFAAWGIHPYTILVHFTLGLTLAHVAYRSRSLLAPFVAHYLFNLMTISASFLAPLYYGADLAKGFMVGAGIVSTILLGYNYWAHRQDKAALRKDLVPASGPIIQKKTPRALLGLLAMYLTAAYLLPLAPWSLQNHMQRELPQDPQAAQQAPELPTVMLQNQIPQPRPVTQPSTTKRVSEIAEQAQPAVINLFVQGSENGGSGSGFIIDKSGLAVTNAHVAEIALPNGSVMFRLAGASPKSPMLPAKIISVNKYMDVAFLRLPTALQDGWPTLELAENLPKIGDLAIALGFPHGLPFSVSQGIVSGVDFRRGDYLALNGHSVYSASQRYMQNFLQIDTTMNPGNSGGPLFNEEGKVIGISTFIESTSGGSQGLNFAIRADSLAEMIKQFRRTGSIDPTWLGLIVNPRAPISQPNGLSIEYVRPGSPADKAGLKAGDMIVAAAGGPLQINPYEIGPWGPGWELMEEFLRRTTYLSPGENLPLMVVREGEEQPIVVQTSVTLGNEKDQTPSAAETFRSFLPNWTQPFFPF